MITRSKKRNDTEHEEQVALCQWLFYRSVPYYAIPNGAKRNVRIAVKLKKEGVQAGVPDLCIPMTPPLSPSYKGTYIEMKIATRKKEKNGGCSPSQLAWHSLLRAHNYLVQVCYGYEEAKQYLEQLGY